MNNRRDIILKYLKPMDYLMFKDVYIMRCLTLQQAWNLYYKPLNLSFHDFVKKRISALIRLKLINLENNRQTYVIFLTNEAIGLVKERFNIATDVFNVETMKIEKGYQTEAKLSMLPRLINHQVALNQFVIDFRQFHRQSKCPLQYRYYDEKYMSRYRLIRPDGMIAMPGLDLFLEQDMGTESKKQLLEKWNKYRMFMNTGEYVMQNNKIVVMFILNCSPNQMEARRSLVLKLLFDTIIEGFGDKFEVYIGSKNELINCLFKKIIPVSNSTYLFDEVIMERIVNGRHGFTVSQGSRMKQVFKDSAYNYYIRKIAPNQRVLSENGKVQEFLLDEHIGNPVSTFNKIALLRRSSSQFRISYKREIEYIILLSHELAIYNDLRLCGLDNISGIYFTTAKRLALLPLHKAIFTIDGLGNMFHFMNSGLQENVFEKNIKKDSTQIHK